jgi:hypothetical protein
MCATVVDHALQTPIASGNSNTIVHFVRVASLRIYAHFLPPRTNSLDSNSTPDRHTDRRRDRRRHRPFAAGDTCPDPVVGVLAGSTCPAVGLVDRTGPGEGIVLVVVHSPDLVAGMGWASRIG